MSPAAAPGTTAGKAGRTPPPGTRAAHRQAADAMLGRVPIRGVVEITTPEGVPIRFTVSAAGDRVAALLLDMLVLFGALLALVFLLVLSGLGGWTLAALFLALFAMRHAYFAALEAGPRGATIGKRALGLRVIDRTGAPLTTEAVLVRNLTREVELWVPMIAVFLPEVLFAGAPGPVRLVALLWLLVFAGFPLTNRLRLRIGDLLAGTMVVVAPKAALLADVVRRTEERGLRGGAEPAAAEAAAASPAGAASAPAHAFTDAQLDVYGIYELQVLEDVLRRGSVPGAGRDAMEAVAERIRKKIRWTGPQTAAKTFLAEFYAALRARLERRMLFGKRKEDKWSR